MSVGAEGEEESVCTGGTACAIPGSGAGPHCSFQQGKVLPFSPLPHLRDVHCDSFHEDAIRKLDATNFLF